MKPLHFKKNGYLLLLAMLLMVFSSCAGNSTKTIIIEKKTAQQGNATKDTELEYTLNKIYKLAVPLDFSVDSQPYVWVDTAPYHLIHTQINEDKTKIEFTSVAYHYGFYDELCTLSTSGLRFYTISPDGRFLVYAVESNGKLSFNLYNFRNGLSKIYFECAVREDSPYRTAPSYLSHSISYAWTQPANRLVCLLNASDVEVETAKQPIGQKLEEGMIIISYDVEKSICRVPDSLSLIGTDNIFLHAVSDDGKKLIVSGNAGETRQTWMISAESGFHALKSLSFVPRWIAFDSPITALYSKGNNLLHWTYGIADGATQDNQVVQLAENNRIQNINADSSFSISSDGNHIAYVVDDGNNQNNIYIADLTNTSIENPKLVYKSRYSSLLLSLNENSSSLLIVGSKGNTLYESPDMLVLEFK